MKLRDLGLVFFVVVAWVALIAVSSAQAQEVDQQLVAEEQLKRLDEMYKGLDAYCAAKSFHADLVIECKAKKLTVKQEFGERINLIISKRLNDSREKVRTDKVELDCLENARTNAESANTSYSPNDTCAEVNAKVSARPTGSGN